MRETSSRIDDGHSYFNFFFVLNGQLPDRAGGTDLTAEGASKFAITDGGNKPGCPYSLKSGFDEGRLEAVGDADFHAFSATNAPSEKFPLIQCSRRPDQWGIKKSLS